MGRAVNPVEDLEQTRRRGYDYASDHYGALCLALASEGKARTCFGALLVKDGEIIGRGRNRRSEPGENELLGGGVDYAAHAEQAAVLEALRAGHDLAGSEMYVLGKVLTGPERGKLSVRATDADHQFSCVRCARMFARFEIPVSIPLPSGWHRLEPQECLHSAEQFRGAGRSRVFTAA